MSLPPLVGIAAVGAALLALLGGLRALRGRCHPELLRKLVHVGMGLVTLSFPWLFDTFWPVGTLAGMSVALMLSLRLSRRLRARLGGVLDGVDRQSLGEVYFPVGVAALFFLSAGDRIAYAVPLILLAVGDAVAALVGVRYGRQRYTTDEGSKSWEGSAAFLLVAFLAVHLPLLLATDTGRTESVLIAAVLALLIAVLEAASWAGLDNLFIPLGAFALLRVLRRADTTTLANDLLAALVLVAFALLWRRRTTLTDSAAVGAALVAFVAVATGGWRWGVAPITLFAVYALVFPRHTPGHEHAHTARDVGRATAVGMLWCFGAASFDRPDLLLPYTASFGAHLAIIGVVRAPGRPGGAVACATVGSVLLLVPFALMERFVGATLSGEALGALGLAAAGVFLATATERLPIPTHAHAWLRQAAVLVGSSLPLAAPFLERSLR